jgi:WhiB family transcriptional regulator, redox-sensing transcriptional regulator
MDERWAKWLIGCGPWRQFAACRSADPELFFPVTASGRQEEEAKAICAGCSVRSQCLTFATLTSQEHGIWGGLTDEERRTPGSGPSSAAQGREIGLWDMKSAIGSNR